MKKAIRCLLFLGLITGCAQQVQEQPEEQEELPAVDEPQQPVEPNEENEQENNSQPETENNDELSQLISYKIHDIEYSPSQAYALDDPKGLDMKIQVPKIVMIQNDEINAFNDKMDQLYDEGIQSLSYSDEVDEFGAKTLLSCLSIDSQVFLENDILSIVIYQGAMNWQAGLPPIEMTSYNYSLTENKFVTNEELFKILVLSIDEMEKELSVVLTDNYKKIEDGYLPEYGQISEYNPEYTDCIYYEITNDSTIYLNDGLHFVIKGYSGTNQTDFDVQITY